jgi:hypothetical protein
VGKRPTGSSPSVAKRPSQASRISSSNNARQSQSGIAAPKRPSQSARISSTNNPRPSQPTDPEKPTRQSQAGISAPKRPSQSARISSTNNPRPPEAAADFVLDDTAPSMKERRPSSNVAALAEKPKSQLPIIVGGVLVFAIGGAAAMALLNRPKPVAVPVLEPEVVMVPPTPEKKAPAAAEPALPAKADPALAQKLEEEEKKAEQIRLDHRSDDFALKVDGLKKGVKAGNEAEGGNVLNSAFIGEVNQIDRQEREREARRTKEEKDRMAIQIAKKEEERKERFKQCQAKQWRSETKKRIKAEKLRRTAALDPDSASASSEKERIDDDARDLNSLIDSVNNPELCEQALNAIESYFKPQPR